MGTSSKIETGHGHREVSTAIKCLEKICENHEALNLVKGFSEFKVEQRGHLNPKLNKKKCVGLARILDESKQFEGKIIDNICFNKRTYKSHLINRFEEMTPEEK